VLFPSVNVDIVCTRDVDNIQIRLVQKDMESFLEKRNVECACVRSFTKFVPNSLDFRLKPYVITANLAI